MPLSNQLGTNETVKATFWPWLEPFASETFDVFETVSSSLGRGYRGTLLISNSAPLGPYSRTMPRALWKP